MAVKGTSNAVTLIGLKSGSTCLTFKNVIEGVGSASPQPFSKDGDGVVSFERNQKRISKVTDEFTASITIDRSDYTQLETWSTTSAKVYISALTDGGAVYNSPSPFTITAIESIDGVADGYVISARRSGLDGYLDSTKRQAGLYASSDLLRGYAWEAVTGANVPAGWTFNSINAEDIYQLRARVIADGGELFDEEYLFSQIGA